MILEELKFNVGKIDILLGERGRTRADLAKALGKSYNTVKAMLNKKIVTTDDLEKIADYLGITILEFIDRPQSPPLAAKSLSQEIDDRRKQIETLQAESSNIMWLEELADTQKRYIKYLEEHLRKYEPDNVNLR